MRAICCALSITLVLATPGSPSARRGQLLPQQPAALVNANVVNVEMGMTPLQALQSATSVAADLLALSSRVGALESGLDADLVVVERNPLEQVRALQDPLLVVSNGRVVVNRLTFARPEVATSGSRGR
jgi:adenine deaminase